MYSVEQMQGQSTDVERPSEPINHLTGIFLKSVYFLDPSLIKSVISGIFKNRDCSLGVLFKGRKGSVYWSHDVFNQFYSNFNTVTLGTENRSKVYFKVDTGESIKVCSVFGKPCVFISDGEHTLSLNTSEWTQFVNNLPLVNRSLRELFFFEDLIKEFVLNTLSTDDLPQTTISPVLADRLTDELQLYIRWPTSGQNSCH